MTDPRPDDRFHARMRQLADTLMAPQRRERIVPLGDVRTSPRVVPVVAAASVVTLGVGGLYWAIRESSSGPSASGTVSAEPTPPAESAAATVLSTTHDVSSPSGAGDSTVAASTTTPGQGFEVNARGGPTQFPVLDPAVVSGATLTGTLWYAATAVPEQASAAVARMNGDGSVAELYTMIGGTRAQSEWPTQGQTFEIGGFEATVVETDPLSVVYLMVDEYPLMVVGEDPVGLLQDPAMRLAAPEPGEITDTGFATFAIESTPADVEVVAAPSAMQRGAATAALATEDSRVTIRTSLDSPLTNLNLTEGSTITSATAGDRPAWVVTFPGQVVEGEVRVFVVWQVDDLTWAEVVWAGSVDEALDVAASVTFDDDAGTWMTRYDVDLPVADVAA